MMFFFHVGSCFTECSQNDLIIIAGLVYDRYTEESKSRRKLDVQNVLRGNGAESAWGSSLGLSLDL